MIRKIAITAALLTAGGTTAAMAQAPQGISQHYADCAARAQGNTVQADICAQSEIGAQDARLNKAYQQVMHQLASDPAKKLALRTEERSWLKQRDYQCKLSGQIVDDGCLVTKTAARADQLESQVRF